MNSLDKMEEEQIQKADAFLLSPAIMQRTGYVPVQGWDKQLARLTWQAATAHANSEHSAILEDYDRLAKLCEKQDKDIALLQCRIDQLMLEYCPNEMTPEQLVNWGNHQIPVDAKTQALVDRASANRKDE